MKTSVAFPHCTTHSFNNLISSMWTILMFRKHHQVRPLLSVYHTTPKSFQSDKAKSLSSPVADMTSTMDACKGGWGHH